MPTTAKPEKGLLDEYLAACAENGWNPDADIRMHADSPDETDIDIDDTDDADSVDNADNADSADADDSTSDPDTSDVVSKLKREAAKRRTQLKPWAQLARDFNMTPEQVREALDAAGATPDPEQQRIADAEAKANLRLVRANVKEAAAGLFADPADAALYLDLTKYEVDVDGDLVDTEELLEDLNQVLERKPHLAASGKRKDPKPNIQGQGRRDATITGLEAGAAKARQRYGSETATA